MKRIALLGMVLSGCTTLRGNADAAYAHGDYMQAAQLYGQLAASAPQDRELIARRDKARAAELGKELSEVSAARVARLDAEATGRLALVLDQRDVWGGMMPADLQPSLEIEIDATAARIASEVTAKLHAAGPLGGEDAAAHYGHLLARADFATQRAELHKGIVDAGQARCTQLAAVATTPYWTLLADRYCAHFGVIRDVPQLPEQRSSLAIDARIAGETDQELRALRGALTEAFHKSPWYAQTGAAAAHAVAEGSVDVRAAARDVTLTASWTEQVAYTDYETQSESYQEPYDDTETYWEDVTDSDGTTHSDMKTRTVTKYRTAWRDVQVPVTKYREESNSQQYPAIERTAEYTSTLRVRIDSGLPAVLASAEDSGHQLGYDIDVTIPEGGVRPSRANLPTHEQFATAQHAQLAAHFLDRLKAQYTQQFCTTATYSIEEAARCAVPGVAAVPPPAIQALGQVLGGEASYLGAVLTD